MLVPFTTFFGATLIGKAVIKVTLQSLFVVTVFSKDHLETLIKLIERFLPFLRGRAVETFEKVRQQYHRQPGEEIETGSVRHFSPKKNSLFFFFLLNKFFCCFARVEEPVGAVVGSVSCRNDSVLFGVDHRFCCSGAFGCCSRSGS